MTRTVGPGPGVGVFAQHPRHDKVLLLLVAVNLITLQVVVVGHVQSGREREREEIENQCSAITHRGVSLAITFQTFCLYPRQWRGRISKKRKFIARKRPRVPRKTARRRLQRRSISRKYICDLHKIVISNPQYDAITFDKSSNARQWTRHDSGMEGYNEHEPIYWRQ